ncbi:MAG: hypothetical protein GY850_24025 [bacterium]|nr:hypothetical protein [bacterium]
MKKKRMNGLILAAMAFMLLFMNGCSMSSSGNPGDEVPLALEQFIITTTGGDGLGSEGYDGNGGNGGKIDIELDYGSGGDVKILDTGAADAGFTFPSPVTTYLGDNPLIVAADTTVEVVTEMPEVIGTPYMVDSYYNLFLATAGEDFPDYDGEVTGISVAAGATLTLGLNYYYYTANDTAAFSIENDIHNAGTITVAKLADGISTGGLYFGYNEYGNYYGEAGSSIDLTGIADDAAAPAGTDGGDGGWLWLYCKFFYNQGSIDTSGASDENGGEAGEVWIRADFASYNTGNITATGGQGTAGYGGDGDYIIIKPRDGHNYNSGALDISGGAGTTSGGNAGDSIMLKGTEDGGGDVLNTGDMTANGGNGVSGPGGDGEKIALIGYGGSMISSGNMTATGGTSTEASGGEGGKLEIYTDEGEGYPGGDLEVGNIELSGNIDLSGGTGTYGGKGGNLRIYLDAEDFPLGQNLILYGYTNINTNGGDGKTGGGKGGSIEVLNDESEIDNTDGPSGGVINRADIDTSGGGVTGDESGGGGNGGNVTMETEDESGPLGVLDAEVAINYGNIIMNGGNGIDHGGDSGEFSLYGFNRAENNGAVTANGGDATAGYGGGGCSKGIEILSDAGSAVNTKTITAEGGGALGFEAYAGDGGCIDIVGSSADNSGNLSNAGGDANITDGYGGSSDFVFIHGEYESTVNTATSIDVSPGAGFEPGEHGIVVIGGFNVTDTWYTP